MCLMKPLQISKIFPAIFHNCVANKSKRISHLKPLEYASPSLADEFNTLDDLLAQCHSLMDMSEAINFSYLD